MGPAQGGSVQLFKLDQDLVAKHPERRWLRQRLSLSRYSFHPPRGEVTPLVWRQGLCEGTAGSSGRMGERATESDILSPSLLNTFWSASLPSLWLRGLCLIRLSHGLFKAAKMGVRISPAHTSLVPELPGPLCDVVAAVPVTERLRRPSAQ